MKKKLSQNIHDRAAHAISVAVAARVGGQLVKRVAGCLYGVGRSYRSTGVRVLNVRGGKGVTFVAYGANGYVGAVSRNSNIHAQTITPLLQFGKGV